MDLEASQVASLQQSIREEASTRDLWPVKRPSADVPTIGIEPVTTEVPVRSRRGLFIGGVLVAAALAGGAGLMFAGGAEEVVATLDAAAAPLPATLPVAALPDPAPADPAPVPDPDPTPPTSTPKKSSSQVQAEKHIRAAEAARRDGNFLLQLAQADEARQLDPKNRRAAELMGEALVKSGDSERGCRLLRGSRLHRQVGCAD